MADAPITVRRIETADWPVLRAIRLEALSDAPEAFGSTLETTRRLSARQWRQRVATNAYFVAEREGVVVGMVSGGYNDNLPGTHWLYGMYVTPAARGSVAAQLLVAAVVEWARGDGAREIYLHVASGVPRARAFYLKNGFTLTGEPFEMERDPSVTMQTLTRSIARRVSGRPGCRFGTPRTAPTSASRERPREVRRRAARRGAHLRALRGILGRASRRECLVLSNDRPDSS